MAGEDRFIHGELIGEEKFARMTLAEVRMNVFKISMEYSRYEAISLIERLAAQLKRDVMIEQRFSIYVNAYVDTQKSKVPDEFFLVDETYCDVVPDKKIWTREELKSDFPAEEPPAFCLTRYTFANGEWGYDTAFSYETVFGWDGFDREYDSEDEDD